MHIILGIPCQNYLSENRNICIVIVSYAIFSTWSKCSWNNSDYKSVNIANTIEERLSFHGEVFDSSLLNSYQRKSLKNMIKCFTYDSYKPAYFLSFVFILTVRLFSNDFRKGSCKY